MTKTITTIREYNEKGQLAKETIVEQVTEETITPVPQSPYYPGIAPWVGQPYRTFITDGTYTGGTNPNIRETISTLIGRMC